MINLQAIWSIGETVPRPLSAKIIIRCRIESCKSEEIPHGSPSIKNDHKKAIADFYTCTKLPQRISHDIRAQFPPRDRYSKFRIFDSPVFVLYPRRVSTGIIRFWWRIRAATALKLFRWSSVCADLRPGQYPKWSKTPGAKTLDSSSDPFRWCLSSYMFRHVL